MGTPTTLHDCSLSSNALERTEFLVVKGANRIRDYPIHNIRASGNRRHLPSCMWRDMSPALMQFSPCPTINSVR
jgi:hypothetical protein